MLRIYDGRTQVLTDVAPTRGRRLRLRVDGGLVTLADLRRYLVADLIRRAAQRHRLAVSLDSEADGLAALNIYPRDHDGAAAGGGADTWVVGTWVEGTGVEDTGAEDTGVEDTGVEDTETADAHWVVPGPATAEAAEADLGRAPLASLAERGLDPLALRLAFLEHHYRQPVAVTWDELARADAALREWRGLVAAWATEPSRPMCAAYVAEMTGAFDDDLDTQAALGSLRRLADDAEIPPGSKFETAAHLDQLLGLDVVSEVGRAG